MTTTTTERERLGLPKPGAKPTPLEKAREAFNAAIGARDELAAQERALSPSARCSADTLAREGKLTRAQRTELASVNQPAEEAGDADEAGAAAVTGPASRARPRDSEGRGPAAPRARAAQARERGREGADEGGQPAQARPRIAAVEAKALKQAGAFVQLPEGAKPSRGAGKDAAARPHLTYGYMTKEGRGKGARWVLVVTDSYGMAVLPLQVTGALPPIKGGVFIPAEALKAIDKTRAFSLTKKGGIQPVKVTERTGPYM
jgi:hypothetical protein